MVKDLEMSGGSVCLLYLDLPTYHICHNCYSSHLRPTLSVIECSTWWRKTGSGIMRWVPSISWVYATSADSSAMSIPEPTVTTSAPLTGQTWLNPTVAPTVLLVHLFPDICLLTALPFQNKWAKHIHQEMSIHIRGQNAPAVHGKQNLKSHIYHSRKLKCVYVNTYIGMIKFTLPESYSGTSAQFRFFTS